MASVGETRTLASTRVELEVLRAPIREAAIELPKGQLVHALTGKGVKTWRLERGDERDLMECLGNLMDNACKYGVSRVRVRAAQTGDQLVVEVEDDGPGIPQHLRDVILARGVRADSVAAGQGIGLAVAADIAASYNGSLVIGDSELGGARISVQFG